MPALPQRVASLFHQAQGLPPEERPAFLAQACGPDIDLRRRVEELLAADAQPGGPLDPTPSRPHATEAYVKGAAPVEADAFSLAEEAAARQREADALVGRTIAGKYKLLECIGEGGMGAVYVAEQTQPLRRKVAIKLVKAGMDSKQVLTRFEAERQALALMDHPNIARVLDAGVISEGSGLPSGNAGRPFFVMEYVKGIPLTDYCDKSRLTVQERLDLFIPVCQAVQHAHQKGIIHRDLKPSNILVCLYDGKPVPKVIDFGLAKAVHQPLTEHTLYTAHGLIMGTPLYMSPEQAELNNLDIDTRSDVYSLGVVLYELLTGTTPLEKQRLKAAALNEMLRLIKEEEPPRPSTRLSSSATLPSVAAQRRLEPIKLSRLVKGDLDWIVMKCLDKERSRRYETANALVADVQRYLGDEPVLAGPPSRVYRLRKFLRKHRVGVSVAAFVLLALVAGIIGTSLGFWNAAQARDAEAEQRLRAERERDEKEAARKAADDARQAEFEQRKKAEVSAVRIALLQDLPLLRDNQDQAIRRRVLLNLARTLKNIPDHAPEYRDFTKLCILLLGQEWCDLCDNYELIREAWPVKEISPDGRSYVTIEEDGSARVWNLPGRTPRASLRAPAGKITLIWFAAKGTLIGTVTDKRVVQLWETATGQLRCTLPAQPGEISLLRGSPDGTRLLTVGDACEIGKYDLTPKNTLVQLWDTRTGTLLRRLEGHQYTVNEALFDPQSARLYTAGHDRTARVWSAADGREEKVLRDFQGPVIALGVSASGRRLATSVTMPGEPKRLNSLVQCWNTDDWSQALPAWNSHDAPVFNGGTSVGGREWINMIKGLRFLSDDFLATSLPGDDRVFVVLGRNGRITMPLGDVLTKLDGSFGLAEYGRLYELPSMQPPRVPAGLKYHPEYRRFAVRGRFLPIRFRLVDLQTELELTLRSGAAFCPLGPDEPALYVQHWLDIATNFGVIGLCPDRLDAAALAAWASLVVRGELDEFDEFKAWDETTWQAKRQDYLRTFTPTPSLPFPGQVASDPHYWLRQETVVSGWHNSTEHALKALHLHQRLLQVEPTKSNYAMVVFYQGVTSAHVQALQDEFAAVRRFGPIYWRTNSSVGLAGRILNAKSEASKENLELALRWLDEREAAGCDKQWSVRAQLLYRLERFEDALALFLQAEKQARHDLLDKPWRVPWEIVVDNRVLPSRGSGFVSDQTYTLRAALCLFRLGRLAEAKEKLNRARAIAQLPCIKDTRAGGDDYLSFPFPLLDEVEALIEGKPKPP